MLTMTDLKHAFANALTKVKGYINTHNLICSTDVMFEGLSDNDRQAVEMWYTGLERKFHVTFSKHYLDNKREKAEKMFFRYIAISNPDGTFKTYTQVKDELRKLPFETHYDVTYQNDYLVSDITKPFTGVVCENCHRAFPYDPDDKIFKNISKYMCECGGALSAVINGTKQIYANSEERYVKCDPKQLDHFRNVDFSPLQQFGNEIRERVYNAIMETGKLNAKTLRPLVNAAVAEGNADLLKALDVTFPDLYASMYSKMSADMRRKICAVALPTTTELPPMKIAQMQAPVMQQTAENADPYAGTPYADDGQLVGKLVELFYDTAPASRGAEVTVQVVHEQAEQARVWSDELIKTVTAAFFGETAENDKPQADAASPVDTVDWAAVTTTFFDTSLSTDVEQKPAAEQPVETVDWAKVTKVFYDESLSVESKHEARQTPADDGVNWQQVAEVFFNAA